MKKQWPLDTALSFDPYFGEPGRDGDQGYELLDDGRVLIHIKAPNAKEVVIDQFGTIFKFDKINDEIWEATVDLGRGFKYIIRELFPGHHDWSVWRRCIHSFFPKIFK